MEPLYKDAFYEIAKHMTSNKRSKACTVSKMMADIMISHANNRWYEYTNKHREALLNGDVHNVIRHKLRVDCKLAYRGRSSTLIQMAHKAIGDRPKPGPVLKKGELEIDGYIDDRYYDEIESIMEAGSLKYLNRFMTDNTQEMQDYHHKEVVRLICVSGNLEFAKEAIKAINKERVNDYEETVIRFEKALIYSAHNSGCRKMIDWVSSCICMQKISIERWLTSALLGACAGGHVDLCNELLIHHADSDIPIDIDLRHRLAMIAYSHGPLSMVEFVDTKINKDVIFAGYTMITIACMSNNIDVYEKVRSYYADEEDNYDQYIMCAISGHNPSSSFIIHLINEVRDHPRRSSIVLSYDKLIYPAKNLLLDDVVDALIDLRRLMSSDTV